MSVEDRDPAGLAMSASDPKSSGYDRGSPYYDLTMDSSSRYYVGPPTRDIPSGDDVRAQVEAEVDAKIRNSDSWITRYFAELTRDRDVQRGYEALVSNDTARLAEGLETRQHGGAPPSMYDNVAHERLKALLDSGADSAMVSQSAEKWV